MLPCDTQGMTPDILKSALRNAQGTNVNNLRHHLPLSTLLLGLLLTACSSTPQTAATICSSPAAIPWTLLGEIRWPHDLQFAGTSVGGLSAIDYDPGASEVNQLNRIKLMIATAMERRAEDAERLAFDESVLPDLRVEMAERVMAEGGPRRRKRA